MTSFGMLYLSESASERARMKPPSAFDDRPISIDRAGRLSPPADGGRSGCFRSLFSHPPIPGEYCHLQFTSHEIDYLVSLGLFNTNFIDFLKGLRFAGQVTAPREGGVVFPREPPLTVEAPLAQAQLVEYNGSPRMKLTAETITVA